MLERSNLFLRTGCTNTCLILGSIGILSSIGAAAAASNSLYTGLQQAYKLEEKVIRSIVSKERQRATKNELAEEKRILDRRAKRLGATIFSIGAIATGAVVMISRKAILQEVQLSEQMKSLASTDPLTGISNRRGWQEAIERYESLANRHQLGIGIAVIDLNAFKELNDTQGHEAGDRELRHIANTLNANCRSEDVIARLGSDEFGILLPGLTQQAKHAVEQKIRAALEEEHMNFALGLHITDHGDSVSEAWKQADLAMYRDKRSRTATCNPVSSLIPKHSAPYT